MTHERTSGPGRRGLRTAGGVIVPATIFCFLYYLAAAPRADKPVPEGDVAVPPRESVFPLSTLEESARVELLAKLERGPKRYDQPAEAMEFYVRQRVPDGMELPIEKYIEARQHMRQMEEAYRAFRAPLTRGIVQAGAGGIYGWDPIGPGNVGGRTRAIVIHPTDPDIMYAAGVAGGVWKTTNGGSAWLPLDDTLANLAVCALAMDPVNPDTLYAGTGEGFFNGDAVRGLGIFKTTDGGASWNLLESTVAPAVESGAFFRCNDIEISPNDNNRIYAATRFGVFRSPDGGASWTQVLRNQSFPGSGQNAGTTSVGCTELAVRPDRDPDTIFASFGSFTEDGIYRSTDGGDSWTKLTTGLASSGQGRTALAIAPSNPDVIYACMAHKGGGAFETGQLLNVFRSTDGGDTWEGRVDLNDVLNASLLSNPVFSECFFREPGFSQGWYDNVIAVDPRDENIVWVGGIDLFRSDDGGVNWSPVSYWWLTSGDPGYPNKFEHADQHRLVFHPEYNGASNQIVFVGSDGGIYRTTNARAAGGPTACPFDEFFNIIPGLFSAVNWTSLNNGYQVTQFYHGDSARLSGGVRFLGGTQDNGTNLGLSANAAAPWTEVFGGDGGYSIIDPTNPNIMYVETQGFGQIQKSIDGGITFFDSSLGLTGQDFGLFIVPIAMDPSNPNILWTGGQRPWRTTDGAANWSSPGPGFAGSGSVSAIAVAPTDGNVVYMGTSSGRVAKSTNALSDSPTWTVYSSANGLPSGGFISSVTVDSANPGVAYCTNSRFEQGHVFKTTDGGTSWTLLDGSGETGLPDLPAHWLTMHPVTPDFLYVGTDLGVFVSEDGGATWVPSGLGLPNTVVETLDWQQDDLLVAFTHGRSAFRATVCAPMTFSTQPVDRDVCAGGTATFNVAVTGPFPSYTWTKDGEPVGSDSPLLMIEDVSPADDGAQIHCLVANSCSQVASDTVTLHVFEPPVVTTEPLESVVCDETGVHLNVQATGTSLQYQWFKDGVAIAGAKGPSLDLSPFTDADRADYRVRMVNAACAAVFSATVPLFDCDNDGQIDICAIHSGLVDDCNLDLVPDGCLPRLTAALGPDVTACGGQGPLQLTAPSVTGGVLPYSYFWRIVSGPSNTGLSDPSAAAPQFDPPVAGTYELEVVVTDAGPGDCESRDTLVVTTVPQLLVHAPQGLQVACIGQGGLTIEVDPLATGGVPPYSYAWSIIRGPVRDGLAGADGPTPTFEPSIPGSYTLKIVVREASAAQCQASAEVAVEAVTGVSASAGSDLKTCVGGSVQLGGSPTGGGGSGNFFYQWSVVSGPSLFGLESPSLASTRFIPLVAGEYELQVRVSDASGTTCAATDRVKVSVAEALAVDAGPEVSTCSGVPTAPLGGFPFITGGHAPYTIRWFVVAGGGGLTFSSRTAEHPVATAPLADAYRVRVAVEDDSTVPCRAESETIVHVVELNVHAGVSRVVLIGQATTLGGNPTAAGGAPPYRYEWQLLTNPNDQGLLDGDRTANPSFVGLGAGQYVAQVTVVDAAGCTTSRQVTIQVVESLTPTGGTPPAPTPSPFPPGFQPPCALLGGGGALVWLMLPPALLLARGRRGGGRARRH